MISAYSPVNDHAEDTLRITPLTLADLNGIRRSINSALVFLERPQLGYVDSEKFTNLADATDVLGRLEKIPGMEYVASNSRDRLLALYKLSANLDAARPLFRPLSARL